MPFVTFVRPFVTFGVLCYKVRDKITRCYNIDRNKDAGDDA